MAIKPTSSPPAAPKSATAIPTYGLPHPKDTSSRHATVEDQKIHGRARALIHDGTAVCVYIEGSHQRNPCDAPDHQYQAQQSRIADFCHSCGRCRERDGRPPTSISVEKWLRSFGRNMAPITAPMPKQPKRSVSVAFKFQLVSHQEWQQSP